MTYEKIAYWIAALIGIALIAMAVTYEAYAGDLGGTCCADLEERVAELEATVAKKGNRKVSVHVYGQVNKGLFFWDVEDESDQVVSENSSAESYLGVRGEGVINPSWKAGYVLEIGVGEYERLIAGDDTNGVYTRQANLYLEGPMGRGTIGLASQATDYIAEITTANTAVVARTLSLRPIFGPQIGEALDLFDGQRANVIRYDSPSLSGFKASASWTNADDDSEVWDAALRYAGEFSGFKVAAGVGYRDGIVIPTLVTLGDVGDVRVLSGSASVMHAVSGLFVNAAAGQLTVNFGGGDTDVTAWHLQGGVEQKWSTLGATTLFGEWSELEIDGVSWAPTMYGLGLVQAIDAAALDLYVNVRFIDTDGMTSDDIMTGMVGGRVRF